MTTYTQTLIVAVPEHLIATANHLACLMGETAADIGTFKQANFTDGLTDYAVIATVCTPRVTGALALLSLPPDRVYFPDTYNRAQAEQALALIVDGSILTAVNVDTQEQLAAWGLSAIESEILQEGFK